MKKLLFVLTAVGCLSAAAPCASAAIVTLTGTFSGAQEAAPNASPGTGSVTVVVDDVANTVNVTALNFSGMQGSSIGAGIYCCQIPVAGVELPRIIQLTGWVAGKSGSYTGSFATTNANILSLEGGGGYVNIITDSLIRGEIRADLAVSQAPEPATFAMIGLSLTALGLIKRRKK